MNNIKKISAIFGVVFVLGANITFAKTGKIITETIRIRAEANTDSKIVEMGSLNEEVEIIGEEGNWYKVNFKGTEGYIYNKYIKVDEEEVQATENETTENNNQDNQNENIEETETVQEETNDILTLGNTTTVKTQARLLPNISSEKLFDLEQGKTVTIITTIGNWTKIEFNKNEAWIPNSALTTTNSTTEEQEEPELETEEVIEESTNVVEQSTTEINKAGYISSNAAAHLRSGPGTENESLGKLPRHTVVTVISEENEWYKVSYNGQEGYISKELVTIGEVPEETSSRSQEVQRTSSTSVTNSATSNVVAVAQNYLGSNYVYGGKSPSTGFDCSGFTQYVYGQCGISLAGSAADQASNGTAVSKSELQPGDLLLFTYYGGTSIGHVGIYVGNGQFIHAANANRGVVYDTIDSGYYSDNYAGARRL